MTIRGISTKGKIISVISRKRFHLLSLKLMKQMRTMNYMECQLKNQSKPMIKVKRSIRRTKSSYRRRKRRILERRRR
jgi:hypothetical protein